MKQNTYQVRFRIPNTNNPQQTTRIQATGMAAARRIFEAQYKGMAISSILQKKD